MGTPFHPDGDTANTLSACRTRPKLVQPLAQSVRRGRLERNHASDQTEGSPRGLS